MQKTCYLVQEEVTVEHFPVHTIVSIFTCFK